MCKSLKLTAIISIVFCGLCIAAQAAGAAQQVLDLSGKWSFQLDEKKVGVSDQWFKQNLKDKISLPGSTDEAGFGKKSEPESVREAGGAATRSADSHPVPSYGRQLGVTSSCSR